MSKRDFQDGTSTVQQFFDWINERHAIYIRKDRGDPKPWTEDPVMLQWKFTNVFRELDKGTKALRKMINDFDFTQSISDKAELIAFNIIWYRSFNRYEHATDIGFVQSHKELEILMRRAEREGKRIFTSAHMTVGAAGQPKIDTVLEAMWTALCNVEVIVELCRETNSLQEVFERFPKIYGCGPFIRYEIVTDFRWYDQLLGSATDRLTWANIGPGCRRGLRRLGLPDTVESLRILHAHAAEYLADHVKVHYGPMAQWPPFELREIEHSLCEFDKYERARTGAGRPKEKYDGRS